MSEISDHITYKSDRKIEEDIGAFVKAMRIQRQKTQSDLAKEASISRSTLSLLENGESGSLSNLIKVLRILDQLYVFNDFKVQKRISPLALAKVEEKERVRVRRKTKTTQRKTDW